MQEKTIDELYNKISELEQKKIAYLEVDNNSYANRIQKQINKIETEIELLNLNEIKKELSIYKKVVEKYPGIQCEVQKALSDQY